MKAFTAFILTIILCTTTTAQNNYTLQHSTGNTYTSINNSTSVFTGNSWQQQTKRVALGFSFTYAGKTFDSLTISWDGYLLFDKNHEYLFSAMHQEFLPLETASGRTSAVVYETTGSAGNKIFKIEYRNCGLQSYDPTDFVNFQVWLYEANGTIEFRMGESVFYARQLSFVNTQGLSQQQYNTKMDSLYTAEAPRNTASIIGIINNNATEVYACVLKDAPANPQAAKLTTGQPLATLSAQPRTGMLYRFLVQ